MEEKLLKKLEKLNLSPYLEYCNTTFIKVGSKDVPMLVFDNGIRSKKKLLITAGSDADELDGIISAFRLAKRFSLMKLHFKVVVLPIMNPSAFLESTDYTPVDMKFLKYYYPGDKNGTYTLKLADQLARKYIKGSTAWVDLHGGNSYERMTSYLAGYSTDDMRINRNTKMVLTNLKDDMVIYEQGYGWDKIDNLCDDGITYFISEAGEGLKTSKKLQNMHIKRVDVVAKLLLGKLKFTKNIEESEMIMINGKRKQLWTPAVDAGDVIEEGGVVGYLQGLLGTRVKKAKRKMKVLWVRMESKLEVNQTVCGGVVLEAS